MEEQACATECASLDGCAFFHVMTSDGCMVEGGAKVCSPWAECTYFSECSPIKPDDEGLWTANVYVLRARAPASSGVGGNGPLPAAFFKRVGIDVATTLRAATAISNLITKGARRELAPHRRLDACNCETYYTTGATPGDTGCWANAADAGDFRIFCCPGGQETAMPGVGMECPTSRNTGGDSVEESAVAPGAGGSTTTACPEKPECTCENAWTGESPPCLAFRNECQTVEGQCNADGTVTPAGEVASPPPPSPGPSPPPGRAAVRVQLRTQILSGRAVDPRMVRGVREREAKCKTRTLSAATPPTTSRTGSASTTPPRCPAATTGPTAVAPSATSRATTSATTRRMLKAASPVP